MSSVVLAGVKKVYGRDVVAVDNLDLEVEDGEMVVVVGPSGCGKSTTLRLIAGLEETTSGEIWIGERRVTELLPKERDVAMVFQSAATFPYMTVADNIGFGLRLRRRGRRAPGARGFAGPPAGRAFRWTTPTRDGSGMGCSRPGVG
jgi:multiple sugar transport system ATP-binding protein